MPKKCAVKQESMIHITPKNVTITANKIVIERPCTVSHDYYSRMTITANRISTKVS